jgi:hypothetical protein
MSDRDSGVVKPVLRRWARDVGSRRYLVGAGFLAIAR